MCRSLHFFYLLKRWGLQWNHNHQELISGYYLSVSGWGLQRLLRMMFTSAEPHINHHIPLTFCLTPSFVLWLLCWCVSLLQQNCHQRSSRFQSIQHSTCNIYIRAHVCVYLYIYISEAAFCKAIAQTLQRLSEEDRKKWALALLCFWLAGRAISNGFPSKFGVFGGSLTSRYRVNYDYCHMFTSTWGTHEIYDWSDIFQIGISGHQQSSLDVLNILLETNPGCLSGWPSPCASSRAAMLRWSDQWSELAWNVQTMDIYCCWVIFIT